jgi:hypothetical protein
MLPNVPKTSSTQQGIAQGMKNNVSIRMAQKTLFKGYSHTSKNQFASMNQPVHVVS